MKKIVQRNLRKVIKGRVPRALHVKPQPNPLAPLVKDPKRMAGIKNKRKQQLRSKSRYATPSVTQELFVKPKATHFPIIDWFTSTEKVDVSVIVPLYKSETLVLDQIKSWDLSDDGLKKEIIYVDDKCPNKSYQFITRGWESRLKELQGRKVGKIILHDRNGGFAQTCNTGAEFATGDFLIFLNADCTVTPNWIKPIIDLMKSDPTIGVVGNMQLSLSGNIDSAGSGWFQGSFQHIGRNVLNGQKILVPIAYKNAPPQLLQPDQRQMVTGACMAIGRKIFSEIGGFDISYRIGYWEDADLCMKVHSLGLKVYFQPQSIVYHRGGHSKAFGHKFASENRRIFNEKWVRTQKIDRLLKKQPIKESPVKFAKLKRYLDKVVGCVIACNEEEFLEASVDSLAPIVDEWVFVIGGNDFAHHAGMCDARGYPLDNTLEIARKLASKYGGTVIEPHGIWKDKIAMRQAYAARLAPGNWMFLQDADEVYDAQQREKIIELLHSNYQVITMQYWSFWNNVNTIGTGKWDQFPCERIVKWQSGYKYKTHLNVTANERFALGQVPTWKSKDKMFYHYSWIRPIQKIKQKLLYYKFQSNIDTTDYLDKVFLQFRRNPQSVQGKTHPTGGGNFALFTGSHPPEVQKLISESKLNF